MWRLARRALRPPDRLPDGYLDWLMLVNAGMQHPGNLRLFDLAVAAAPQAPMLEIGSFCGLSANIISYLKRVHGRQLPLFTCDSWRFEGADRTLPPTAPVGHAEIRAHVIESFRSNVRRFSADDLPFTIEASSDEFFEAWGGRRDVTDVFGRHVVLGGDLGFCFIDGNHGEEQALRDFTNCDRCLLTGGFILFDDSAEGSGWPVTRVIAHVKSSRRYEVVARNPNYLLRKRAA
jgi:Methyltransferase domain